MRSIPDVVQNTFASPELNQTKGTKCVLDIKSHIVLLTMSPEPMHGQSLRRVKTLATLVARGLDTHLPENLRSCPSGNQIGNRLCTKGLDLPSEGLGVGGDIRDPFLHRLRVATSKDFTQCCPPDITKDGTGPASRALR